MFMYVIIKKYNFIKSRFLHKFLFPTFNNQKHSYAFAKINKTYKYNLYGIHRIEMRQPLRLKDKSALKKKKL